MTKERVIKNATVLIVEDEKILRISLRDDIRDAGYEVITKDNPIDALDVVKTKNIDIVISDIQMPRMNGMELLKKIKETDPGIVVIMITAYASVDSAVTAMKSGANDYITKPFRIEELLVKLEKIVELIKIRKENTWLKSDIEKKYQIDSFIGISPQIETIKELVRKVASSNTSVLITGETGTGKELLTNIIHYNSKRKNEAIVKVSCAILAREVFESELFGHEKGAFTGASKRRIGRFESADGGTIYLDDIDDIPYDMQVKLLRVLQENELQRVGGNETVNVDTRVIASTKYDLLELAGKGNFREDLYYRLNIFPIHISPLRERKDDIPFLIEHFISVLEQKPKTKVTSDAMDILLNYSWPGNIRELRNITERLLLLATDNKIRKEILPPEISRGEIHDSSLDIGNGSLEDMMEEFEIKIIKKALDISRGNMAKAAKLLLIPSSTLRTKIYKYKLS